MITFNELEHPMGKGAAASHIRYYLQNLNARYQSKIEGFVDIKIYKNGDTYVIHCKIPSESNADYDKDIFYDVIMECEPLIKEHKSSPTIEDYGVRVASNCPSYLFTFTHTFHERNALPKILPTNWFGKKALKEKARVRNPLDLIGVEKTIWFTIKYMRGHRLFHKNILDSKVLGGIKRKDLISSVLNQESKFREVEHRSKHFSRKSENKVTRNNPSEGASSSPQTTKSRTPGVQDKSTLNKALASNLKSDLKKDRAANLKRQANPNKLKSKLKR